MNKQFYCHQDRIALTRHQAALHMGAGHEVEALDVMLEDKRDNFTEDLFPQMVTEKRFHAGMKA